MSEFLCPECSKGKFKYVSSHAKACPDCGFPMADFLKEHNLTDEDVAWVCPKCGDIEGVQLFKRPICEYCNIPVIQTNIPGKVAINKTYSSDKESVKSYEIEVANKYGGNQFSEEAYQHRIHEVKIEHANIMRKERLKEKQRSQSQPTNTPTSQVTCPYCQSTNTKKITAGDRVKSNILFGIFAKNRNKEWHCNSCNSDF